MIQHCLQCDRPMHLRGGDMTTTCAECLAEHSECAQEHPSYKTVQEHPLPRSEAHDLDARALKARCDKYCEEIDQMRDRLVLYAKVVLAARGVIDRCDNLTGLQDALAALDAKEGG